MPIPAIPRYRIQNAARIYNSNEYAAQAMGITPQTFGRLCRKYGITTPDTRRKRVPDLLDSIDRFLEGTP